MAVGKNQSSQSSQSRRKVIARTRALVVHDDGTRQYHRESLAGEEPLEIRVNGQQFVVTMRTPGNDFFLVAGYLLNEGIVSSPEQIDTIKYCGNDCGNNADRTFNVIDCVVPHLPAWALDARRVTTTSACGVCGTTSIDQVAKSSHFELSREGFAITQEVLLALPDKLRSAQKVFDSTGGLHGAALFDACGELLYAAEDVGRHNAVDKVLGQALLDDALPLSQCVMQVSGRTSFELVQKCVMAGVPMLAAVSAPSSLAVDLAKANGLTLVGFSRGSRATVYSHNHRVLAAPLNPIDSGSV